MSQMSRRAFMHSAVAAAAATSAAAPARAQANERIGFAVIGCRNRGPKVGETLIESGRFDLVSLCDCDTAMFGEAAGRLGEHAAKARHEQDFRRVLDDPDVDAVVIATPDHWHAMMTVMAFDAGKHVFVEKPASYNIDDGKAMVAAQRRHPGLVGLVGTQQRSGPHFAEARDFIREGNLGTIGFARAWITHHRGLVPEVPDAAPPATMDYDLWLGPAPWQPYNPNRVHYNWRFMRDFGTGEMGNWGAHWVDIVRWYLDLGTPSAAMGHGGKWVQDDAKEWPDTQTVVYKYPGLSFLWEQRLWTEYGAQGMGTGAEFGGDQGSVIIDRGGWTFHPRDGEPVAHPARGMESHHARHFADCIRGDAEPVASIEEGHETAVVCHLGNLTVLSGRSLEFDSDTQSVVNDPEAEALMGYDYREPWKLPT